MTFSEGLAWRQGPRCLPECTGMVFIRKILGCGLTSTGVDVVLPSRATVAAAATSAAAPSSSRRADAIDISFNLAASCRPLRCSGIKLADRSDLFHHLRDIGLIDDRGLTRRCTVRQQLLPPRQGAASACKPV